MNNFQQLYEEEELRFTASDHAEVLHSIQGTLRFFRMIGDVAEIYLGNMAGVLVDAIDPSPELPSSNAQKGMAPPHNPSGGTEPNGPSEPPA